MWRRLCRLSPSRTAPKRAFSEALFPHSSPVQTVQLGGSNCYYAEGWNGRGWYQCGSEWNYGFGWIGPFNLNTFGASASRRHHRHGAVVSYPRALNPVYPRLEPPRRLGAHGAPAFHTFGAAPGLHRFGAGGVPTAPNIRPSAATVFPSFAGGGFRGGLGGGNFHHFHSAGIPHTGAPVSPGFGGGGGFHRGLGGAAGFHGVPTSPHIGAPASPGFIGGGFHGPGGAGGFHGVPGVPHIGAPASPGFTGGGGLRVPGAAGGFHGVPGVPHIGAPTSPGFIGGGGHR
jgi:hypothetical protein